MQERISKGVAEVIDIVMPGQTNHYGTLFGGLLIAQMDKAANIAATRYAKGDCVTVSVDNIVFEKSIKLGEIVVVKAQLLYVGKTSLLIRVTAESETQTGERKVAICCANFVFVCVDKAGNPVKVPEPIFDTEEEKKMFQFGKEIKEQLRKN